MKSTIEITIKKTNQTIEVVKSIDGGWVGWDKEDNGICTHGDTLDALIERFKDATKSMRMAKKLYS